MPIIFKERGRIEKEIKAFLDAKGISPEIINTGELSDSLMQEGEDPFSAWIMGFFKGSKHKILFLTKSTNVHNFLKNEWQKNAILSWSINADAVSKRWENYAPTVRERLEAAAKVAEQGYEVRLRIDPMVPILNWQQHYAELVETIFSMFTPERVTLGCLRGLISTIVHAKDKSWVKYLKENSNWGKKPPFEERFQMYEVVTNSLHRFGLNKFGVCKDTVAMWRKLAMNPEKIKCNCIW